VGLDFGMGVSNVIAQINYCPRAGSGSRMVGGIFRGANRADFNDAVTLFTITTQPAAGGFTSVGVADTNAFRYVFYLSPNGGFGNVAELQFYGYVLKPPQPHIVGVSIAGGSLRFSGTNGLIGGAYAIWSSTNLATPLTNWTQAGSGYFDGNGNFSVSNVINLNAAQQFFMLRLP
jgi:hypothetical protein